MSAELVARLIACNAPPDLIDDVLALAHGADRLRKKEEERKAKDRARKPRKSEISTENVEIRAVQGNPAPSEPLPSSLLPSEEKGKDEPLVRPKTPRPDPSTRLPADWRPSPAGIQFALDEGFSPDAIQREAERFRDYWHGKPGAAGRKLDWEATWRNWLRNATDRGQGRGAKNGKPQNSVAKGLADALADFEHDRPNSHTSDDETGGVLARPVQGFAGRC